MIIDDGVVQIPRQEILKRKYVLKPLQDLAPDMLHPVEERKLTSLWLELDAADPAELQTLDAGWLPHFPTAESI